MRRYAKILICFLFLFFTALLKAQLGCTDPLANNYNSSATQNDGSCTYQNANISPIRSSILPALLDESSGLIFWNDRIWTHNDDIDINLYNFHPDTLSNIASIPLVGTVNIDQEEISQDSNFIYIGDFGNNANGNRTDLKILRINKLDLLQNLITVDTLFFSYSDQTNFSSSGANNTDFDCESFIVTSDSIYLFTKQWISQKTALYVMPKTPGTHIASFKAIFDVQGLISGAYYNEEKRLLVLAGYSSIVQPFIYLFYDFTTSNFFGANKRKITLSLPFHQVEGICSPDGLKYYLTNERLVNSFLTIDPKIHELDLSQYLDNYLNPPVLSVNEIIISDCAFYPNPSSDYIYFDNPNENSAQIIFTNMATGVKSSFELLNSNLFNLSNLNLKGLYHLSILNMDDKVLCSDKIFVK